MSIRQHFPKSVEQTPWWTAILSLAPFLLLGPLAPIFHYPPWWNADVFSRIQAIQGPLVVSLLFLGFLIGLVRRFPRWAYLYTLYILFLIPIGAILLVGRVFSSTTARFGNNLFSLLVLLLAALLIIARGRLGFLRPFFSNIRQDGSLLSYALYAAPFFFYSMNDSWTISSLKELVQLIVPSLIIWLGALAYLRLADPLKKAGALLAATLLGGLIYGWPVRISGASAPLNLIGGLVTNLIILAILCGMVIVPLLINSAFPPRSKSLK